MVVDEQTPATPSDVAFSLDEVLIVRCIGGLQLLSAARPPLQNNR